MNVDPQFSTKQNVTLQQSFKNTAHRLRLIKMVKRKGLLNVGNLNL